MSNSNPSMQSPICPVPMPHNMQIVIGHGSGGKMSDDLIRRVFLPAFENPILNAGNDAGTIDISLPEESLGMKSFQLAISTDSHVVWPLFFPGGNIGRLAICGTVNDIAMMGATPLFITAGFILEEGLDIEILQRVVRSMREAADEAGVQIVAGDTKVVQKGKADNLYINTAGIGSLRPGIHIGGDQAQPGDIVIVSGPIGDHGIAVLAARQDLSFEADVQSDIAPLNHLVAAMINCSSQIHVLRDPTRGGLATTLNEIARQSNICILLDEKFIPVRPAVSATCEMLGFDPLYIANEGKLIAIVGEQDAPKILQAMQAAPYGKESVIIGKVNASPGGHVLLKTLIGTTRIVDVLAGEILPRIC